MATAVLARQGLSTTEAQHRIAQGLSNNFKVTVSRSYWQIVRDNVFNPFNLVLTILFVIMFIQHDYVNIIVAGICVALNIMLGLIQEIKARRTLDHLASLVQRETTAWRDGKLTVIPITQIVKDDVLPLQPGDPILVDGYLIQADQLEVDESHLTGESDTVNKEMGDSVHSGSFCVAGGGCMVATGVGQNSALNKLSATAKTYRFTLTPTQTKINTLVGVCAAAMLILCPLLVISEWINHVSSLELVRNLVVLVMSLIAQGMVLATTCSLLLGAIRISRRHTLIQRINAIEALANVDVLCFDKTGTLTCNHLVVKDILPVNHTSLEHVRQQLRLYTDQLTHSNKTAQAIAEAVQTVKSLHEVQAKTQEIPFTSARRWGAVQFISHGLVLGAAESILNPLRDQAILEQVQHLAVSGLRVVVFASCKNLPPKDQLNELFDCQPLALLALSDEIRHDIRATLQAFADHHIQIKVITGDSLETASAIAKQAGIDVSAAFTGQQLESMSAVEFESAVRTANLFARIAPDTKRKIIVALKHQGLFTAMVGDGVNDVPPLKEANLAIAMNAGVQIAKDVADIVLLDNALSTLPLAFAEGKTITQKIFGTTKLFFAKNLSAVLLIIGMSALFLPFPFTPI